DITPYADEVEVVEEPMRGWRDDPITFETLALGDLDLRISSGETVLGNARLGRTAAAAVARNGAFELSVGEVSAYGGTLNGRLTFAKAANSPRVTASVDFDAVDMAHALGDLFAFRKLEGTGRGSFDLAATGESVDELLHSLTGQASVTV